MTTTDYAPRRYQRDANGFAVSKFTTWGPGAPYQGRHRRPELPTHIGWGPAGAGCTCRKAACGYVVDRIDPACPVHDAGDTTKLHRADACPGGA
jgi:hypothetical protein